MKTLYLIVTSLFFLTFFMVSSANTGKNSPFIYYGIAYDSDDDSQILYRENHSVIFKNDQLFSRSVQYVDHKGAVIATKDNQYADISYQPDFTLDDKRFSYQEKVQKNSNRWLVYLQEDKEEQRTFIEEENYPLVIDAGFDEFVRTHWQELTNNQEVLFDFASAARQDIIGFRINALKKTDDTLTLEMSLRSSILSWLVDPIQLEYDLANRRLRRYRGLSNIQDSDGDGQTVDITYYYPG